MRILIADDNYQVRAAIRGVLSREADLETCGEACDGTEALAKARELSPDLILLDISMPGANGFEISRTLRKEFPALRILIMSQNDAAQLSIGLAEAGADACVDKSRMAFDLISAIRELSVRQNSSLAGTT
jgi:DNA-binding NarL/FixJ family response regulator